MYTLNVVPLPLYSEGNNWWFKLKIFDNKLCMVSINSTVQYSTVNPIIFCWFMSLKLLILTVLLNCTFLYNYMFTYNYSACTLHIVTAHDLAWDYMYFVTVQSWTIVYFRIIERSELNYVILFLFTHFCICYIMHTVSCLFDAFSTHL